MLLANFSRLSKKLNLNPEVSSAKRFTSIVLILSPETDEADNGMENGHSNFRMCMVGS